MSIKELIDEVIACKDKDCPYYNPSLKGTPKIGGSCSSKIMIVSQAPAKNSFIENLMFEKECRAAMVFMNWFCLNTLLFNKRNIFWIQCANCYPGRDGNHDVFPKNSYCADKYIRKGIELLKPKMIILAGACPAIYFGFYDEGRSNLNQLVKPDYYKYCLNKKTYNCIVLPNPANRNIPVKFYETLDFIRAEIRRILSL